LENSALTTAFSYLVIKCLEDKGWLPPGSKDRAWNAVQDCWSIRTTEIGETELVSKWIEVVYGTEYQEEEEEEDDGDGNALIGCYLASDGRIYPLPGYYLASDGFYYLLSSSTGL
jgi:hypothetical protein